MPRVVECLAADITRHVPAPILRSPYIDPLRHINDSWFQGEAQVFRETHAQVGLTLGLKEVVKCSHRGFTLSLLELDDIVDPQSKIGLVIGTLLSSLDRTSLQQLAIARIAIAQRSERWLYAFRWSSLYWLAVVMTRSSRTIWYIAKAHTALLALPDINRCRPFCQENSVGCQFQQDGIHPTNDRAVLNRQLSTRRPIIIPAIRYTILPGSIHNAISDMYLRAFYHAQPTHDAVIDFNECVRRLNDQAWTRWMLRFTFYRQSQPWY